MNHNLIESKVGNNGSGIEKKKNLFTKKNLLRTFLISSAAIGIFGTALEYSKLKNKTCEERQQIESRENGLLDLENFDKFFLWGFGKVGMVEKCLNNKQNPAEKIVTPAEKKYPQQNNQKEAPKEKPAEEDKPPLKIDNLDGFKFEEQKPEGYDKIELKDINKDGKEELIVIYINGENTYYNLFKKGENGVYSLVGNYANWEIKDDGTIVSKTHGSLNETSLDVYDKNGELIGTTEINLDGFGTDLKINSKDQKIIDIAVTEFVKEAVNRQNLNNAECFASYSLLKDKNINQETKVKMLKILSKSNDIRLKAVVKKALEEKLNEEEQQIFDEITAPPKA